MIQGCGEQYRRRYVEGDKLPPGIAMLRGRAIHTSQEKNLLSKMETGELLSTEECVDIANDQFKTEMSGGYVIGGQYEGMAVRDARSKAQIETVDLARLHSEEVAPTINPTAIESRIEIPPSEDLPVTFVSILDLIDGGDTVRDTKTKGKSPSANDAEESIQLTGQHLAFTALEGRPPARLQLDYLVRTPTGKLSYKTQTTTRGPRRVDAFVARARAALHMIEREVFIPAPEDSWKCTTKWCGYAETCPFFRGRKRPTN